MRSGSGGIPKPRQRGHRLAYPHKRSNGKKIARERKKNEGFGAYKEELCALIETKKALATKCKEEKAARWNELKLMEDEKWRAKLTDEARKVGAEERRIALEDERLAEEKKAKEHAIMFMNPSTIDSTARRYWELTHGEILAQSEVGRSGDGGGHGGARGGDEHVSA